MKQKTSLGAQKHEDGCSINSCGVCKNCRSLKADDSKQEIKDASLQLYAKEAENYFFYYAQGISKPVV